MRWSACDPALTVFTDKTANGRSLQFGLGGRRLFESNPKTDALFVLIGQGLLVFSSCTVRLRSQAPAYLVTKMTEISKLILTREAPAQTLLVLL
jgi:hypothetical protein